MIERYFEIYCLTSSLPGRLVRIALFILSAAFIYSAQSYTSLAILVVVIINELFCEHLGRIVPIKNVKNAEGKYLDATLFNAKSPYASKKNAYDVVSKISKKHEIKFFSDKLGISKIEVANIGKDELIKQAGELAVWVKGDYVTTADLFAAYILLSEDETHFIEKNNLVHDDVINVLYWTRKKFGLDGLKYKETKLVGPGVFDELCYGWNFELKKYSRNLTLEVLSTHFPPNVLGLEKEADELTVILSKARSANALIVGEEGTGKKELVRYFAYTSFLGRLSSELNHKKVYELSTDKLVIGIENAGELESRLNILLSDIAHSDNAIVYIKNIENIFGGGGLGLDVSGILSEWLESEKIKIIGTTTPLAYVNYIANRVGIKDLIENIEVSEPDGGKVMLILTEKAEEIEKAYHIRIYYSALKQVVLHSSSYYPDYHFPGKAVMLLEKVASKQKVDKKKILTGDDVINFVQSGA